MPGTKKTKKERPNRRPAPQQLPGGRSFGPQASLMDLQGTLGNRGLARLLGSQSDFSERLTLTPGIPPPQVTRTSSGAVGATLYFGQDNFLLDSRNFRALEQLSRDLPFLYKPRVQVDGHASGEGAEGHNLALSEKRRMTVMAILNSRLKEPMDFNGQAYGESKPAVLGTPENPSPYNRRVEISIIPAPSPAAEPDKPVLPLPPFKPQFEPESDSERLNRMLRKPLPQFKRPRISIAGAVRRKYDEFMNGVLRRFGVPPERRERVKDLVADALGKGAEKALDLALDQTGLDGQAQRALKSAVEAAARTEFEIP